MFVPLQQAEVMAERQAKRAEAFVAPAEHAEPTVEEKIMKKKKRKDREREAGNGEDIGGDGESEKKRKKKKRRSEEAEDS